MHAPTKVARETLPSGRIAHIDREHDDQVIVRVGQATDDGDEYEWACTTLPVRSFPLFGKSLARRIREAIIKLDHPIEETEPDEVEQAVEVALFHGGQRHESEYYAHQEPPLIFRDPPEPPPPPRRKAEALQHGAQVQPPPADPPPSYPPSE